MFRLTVAYDGTGFHGWQKQPALRTVQGELESVLANVLEVPAVPVNGAGRTDAGVHARGQVASFEAATPLPARAVAALASRELPADIAIVEAAEAAPGFHARHSARSRRYRYCLLDREDVLYGRFAWAPHRTWSEDGLIRAVEPLSGEQDCSAFEAAGSSPANPVCRFRFARWRRWEGGMSFEVEADHFLYHMVRNLVGTALQLSAHADPAARMREILASRNRAHAGPTAPPQGLSLEAVRFEGEDSEA